MGVLDLLEGTRVGKPFQINDAFEASPMLKAVKAISQPDTSRASLEIFGPELKLEIDVVNEKNQNCHQVSSS